jgi:hypothetical protein
MPILGNPKWEHFAQELASGTPAIDAYVKVGYKFNRGNCSRLKDNENIKVRVAELLERSARRTDYTVERLIGMIIEDRDFAREQGQAAAAGAATERLARLLGLWTDRTEIKQLSELETMNDPEELRSALIQMAHELGEHRIADALEQADEQEQNAKRH